MNRLFLIISTLFCIFSLSAQHTFDEKLLLQLVNEIRTDGCYCGNENLKPVNEVIWNNKLADIAQNHSEDLFAYWTKNENKFVYLSHVGTDGSTLEDRLEKGDVKAKNIRENIGYVQGNESIVIDHWLNNIESCKNLMNPTTTSIGVGRSGNFWTMLLTSAFFTK